MYFTGAVGMELAILGDTIMDFQNLDAAYLDRGLYFGDGVYEVLRSYRGRIFALDDHLQRFSNSLEAIGIKGVDINVVRDKVVRAFEKSQIANAKIYFHTTRGSQLRSHTWTSDIKPNFLLTITELNDDPGLKTKGFKISTYPDLRWKRCDIKSLNLLPNVLAQQDAAEKDCDEAFLVDENGYITEGASSACFAIIDGKLRTTPLSNKILGSITRKYVIKCADDLDLEVIEKSVTVDQAKQADELFVAVTTKDIVPVVEFDGKAINNSRPGPITNKLIEQFKTYT
jgi:D-alanine transaminase